MKSFIETFKEENAETEYCAYCLEPKGDKYHCCQENHFIPFKELYEDCQMEIIEEELRNAYDF